MLDAREVIYSKTLEDFLLCLFFFYVRSFTAINIKTGPQDSV